jgi:hypothetical protein
VARLITEAEREAARLGVIPLEPNPLNVLMVRRAFVLDAAGVAPGGHVERLAAELGVTADELCPWLAVQDGRA